MAQSSPIDLASRPRLTGFVRLQHDSVRERWVLQAPERVLVLDESGRDIVERCDGRVSVGAIIEALVSDYDAPREVIEHDVRAVLGLLAEKNFLILEEDDGGG